MARALTGEPSLQKNMPFQILRQGFLEPMWFTFSLLTIGDEEGHVAGVFILAMETTEQVQTEQCHRFLLELADRLRPLDDPDSKTLPQEPSSELVSFELLPRH